MKDEKAGRSKSKRVVFEGVLLQPIEGIDPLVRALWTYDAQDGARAAIDREIAEFMSAQYAERIRALAQHYGIDHPTMDLPAFLYVLLIRLAEEFVDGFRIGGRPRLPGRPKGTGKDGNDELFREVLRLQRSHGLSVRSACIALAKRAKYRGEKPLALQARFNRFGTKVKNAACSDGFKALDKRVRAIKAASR